MIGKAGLWILTTTALATGVLPASPVLAASHREAPLISQDPAADPTDVYAFVSWQDPSKVVFIMNVLPGQEPGSGPNYFNFDDNVVYTLNIDNDRDGIANDIVYEIRFTTEFRGTSAANQFSQAYIAVPPITALDGAGSEGLSLRQRYTVTEKRSGVRRDIGTGTMVAVPSNVGPRTIPDYEALAQQGIYNLSNGGRVFAGQRDETFYIDLGAVFDTVNLRASPILSDADDANDRRNPFGVDHFSGFNVNTIAIEVPIADVIASPVIGVYGATERPRQTNRRGDPLPVNPGQPLIAGFGTDVQVARLANPLVNELIIPLDQKDRWNALDPAEEAQFLQFYLQPRLTAQLNLLFGTTFPTTGRTDLVAALLKYPGGDPNVCTVADPCADLLRLDTRVPPTQPGQQKRLTVLAGDPAGFPNGRRPNDDVTDIALRVAAGALLGPVPKLGDGVNFNVGAQGSDRTGNGIAKSFPFLTTPHDGRNRRHQDCPQAGPEVCP